MTDKKLLSSVFNSPFETGVRAAFILSAAYPKSFDLAHLVALDHFVVHSADIGGPESLHPATSTHAAEMLVRRELVREGLILMQSRQLVEFLADNSGFKYRAGPEIPTFTSTLRSTYFLKLEMCARFLVRRIDGLSDEEFDSLIEDQLERWAIQFQSADQSTAER